jgi:hypothetical protein
MKHLAIFTAALSLLATTSAFAVTIRCDIPVKGVSQSKVTIRHLESSKRVSASIDGSLFDRIESAHELTLMFSNECDNMWQFDFPTESVEAVLAGQSRTLSGWVTVSEADLDGEVKVETECRVIGQRRK